MFSLSRVIRYPMLPIARRGWDKLKPAFYALSIIAVCGIDARGHSGENTFTFTSRHLEALRQLLVMWDFSDAGAPWIATPKEYEYFFLAEPDYGISWAMEPGLEKSLAVALQHGTLEPGQYCVPNSVKRYVELYRSRFDEIPRILMDDPICFEFTDQHRMLIRGAILREGMTIDSKHPYGDRSYWQMDAADHLGMAYQTTGMEGRVGSVIFPLRMKQKIEKLHYETWPAMIVFLHYFTLTPGEFKDETGYNDWVRVQ